MKPGTRRVVRNLVLAVGVSAACLAVAWLAGLRDPTYAASMATGYVGLALLVTTLALGPLNVIRARANPLSTHLRRDLGIWAGAVSLIHVAVGLQRHLEGKWWLYFLFPDRGGRLLGLRHDVFGVANWLGLAATVVLVVLMVISNDVSVRRLGFPLWKRVQRWNYALFAGVVLHGFAYQVTVGGRAVGWVATMAFAALCVAGLQALGVRRFTAAPPTARRRR